MKYLTPMFVLAAALATLAATCQQPPVIIEAPNTELCPAACDNLRLLGCEEAEDVDGLTCEQFCERTQKQGAWLDPKCVAAVTSCEEIEQKCAQERPIVLPGEK